MNYQNIKISNTYSPLRTHYFSGNRQSGSIGEPDSKLKHKSKRMCGSGGKKAETPYETRIEQVPHGVTYHEFKYFYSLNLYSCAITFWYSFCSCI